MWVVLPGIVVLMMVYGCGGDGDGRDSGGEVEPSQVAASSADVVERVLDILLGEDQEAAQGPAQLAASGRGDVQLQQEDVAVTLPCESGEVSFDGELTRGADNTFTVQGTVDFDNCEGINGALSLNSSGTTGQRITIAVTLNGAVTAEGCTITFDATSAETIASQIGVITGPILVNGTVRGACSGESIVCILEDINLNDREAFEASCS
jgi:hypothetical protein